MRVKHISKLLWTRAPQPLRYAFLYSHVQGRTIFQRRVRGNVVHPDRLLWVDPARIERSMAWTDLEGKYEKPQPPYFQQPAYKLVGAVRGGDWDDVDRRFENDVVYQTLRAHFEEEVPWEETDLYQQVTGRIKAGEEWWGCTTVASFRERCRHLDRLFDYMATQGYLTQRELATRSDAPLAKRGWGSNGLLQRIYDEIAVHVGRSGEFLFHDGRNRLSIAKILDLDAIPVVVYVRHTEWQRLRNERAHGTFEPSGTDYANHPDLKFLDYYETVQKPRNDRIEL